MKSSLALATVLAALAATAATASGVQFAPGADARDYRKVHIAPARVEFQREFLAEAATSRNPTLRLKPDEIRDLARDMGDEFSLALAEAFRKRGYEIAPAPANDVLRISPALRNLYVNAPDAQTAAMTRSYVREAGGALMAVEASNPAGQRVASASEESTTLRSMTFEAANRVTNRFHFGAMFRAWADDVASAFAAGK
jgi:hypothetical protein